MNKNNKKRRIVFDAEANGLLREVTQCWLIVAYDIDSNQKFIFTDHLERNIEENIYPLLEFKTLFENASLLAGHHIIGYDLMMLKKLFDWSPNKQTSIVDTMIMSQVLNYRRFGFGHSLEQWGNFFGLLKPEHDDWSQFSPEMVTRCSVDTEINVKVFNYLVEELNKNPQREKLREGLRAEHGASKFVARANLNGWPFDIKAAEELIERLEKDMLEIQKEIEPKLTLKVRGLDKAPEYKEVVLKKNGEYAARTISHFPEVKPSDSNDKYPPIWGSFCRIELVEPDLGSIESAKLYLYSIGWEPLEWNFHRESKKPTTPKLCDASLHKLGRDGILISRFYTMRARWSIVSGWLEEVDRKTSRLHGDCFVIGTPTGRSVHKIIANIPNAASENLIFTEGKWSKGDKKEKALWKEAPLYPFEPIHKGQEGERIRVAEAAYGPEIRSLFICEPGYKVVGADSSGNQHRALCHYLGPEAADYTRESTTKDIHSIHASILALIVGSEVLRSVAKPFWYAFLFGAGAGKVALIITGKRDVKLGNEIKQKFANRVPGLKPLLDKLESIFNKTNHKGTSWIPAIDGRKIYLLSFHKALNYLLQSCEKITCAAAASSALIKLDEQIGEDNWQPLIFYHDEIQLMVKEEFAEKAAEIAKESFKEAPKKFGILIMDGESKVGLNWCDTH